MFNRKFAYAFEGACDDEREHEHHHHHHHHGWRHGPGPREAFRSYMRQRFFGPEGPFGAGGPFGPDAPFDSDEMREFFRHGRRFFGRGDLKYVLLELLQERPMHGYELMKELQDRTGGRYTPSPGSIYPTLQMLEDRGFVSASDSEGKKVYTITDAGREFLAAQPKDERHGPRRGFWNANQEEWAEMAELRKELMMMRPLLGKVFHVTSRDPSKLKQLREILSRVRSELTALIDDSPASND